ncbi:Uncharacterised protein [Mycobacteroides abscessus subsp. bolletii]|nr:Uncharacterised protein [Mycobacteroides abscessus subsp. bolletii]
MVAVSAGIPAAARMLRTHSSTAQAIALIHAPHSSHQYGSHQGRSKAVAHPIEP